MMVLPFGCIANHIISKGIEKKVKALYPQLNLLSLDFDSSVSDANVANRLLLFVENIQTSGAPQPKARAEKKTEGFFDENLARREIMI